MIPTRFHPAIIQYAWIVPDLETAARHWHATLGVGPFLVNRNLVLTEPRYRGQPGAPAFSTAVAQSGDVQIELIEQHDDLPSVYRETVPAGRTGFHHVAFVEEDFGAALRALTGQGHAVAANGRFGDMRYAYVDTSAVLGCMVEIIEDKPAIRGFFDAIRKAAERWDGDPATLVRELRPQADT
jgi:hypothetical protein